MSLMNLSSKKLLHLSCSFATSSRVLLRPSRQHSKFAQAMFSLFKLSRASSSSFKEPNRSQSSYFPLLLLFPSFRKKLQSSRYVCSHKVDIVHTIGRSIRMQKSNQHIFKLYQIVIIIINNILFIYKS